MLGAAYCGETYYLPVEVGNTPEWRSQPMLNLIPGSVRIRYFLPEISPVDPKILDATGRVVKNLFSGKITSPSGSLFWDKKDKKVRLLTPAPTSAS